jgi:hypothetical protein
MDALPSLPALLEIPAAEYHADPCPRPSFSHSVAKALLSQSPYHAWLRHPKLGGVAEAPTREMDRGTILHAMVLGTKVPVVVIDADNYRTKAAQEKRDSAHAAGLVPVLSREYDGLVGLADATTAALREQGVELSGISERAILWEEETAAGPVLCRGMIDHLILTADSGAILDLKFGESADPKKLGRKCIDLGYDVQFAAYTSALQKLRPDLAGRGRWLWLFVEELPEGSPKRVIVTVAQPGGMLREHGQARWRRACETWGRCLAENDWPGYAREVVRLEAPEWAMKEVLES